MLLCTIVGNNWERVVTLTDEQVNIYCGIGISDSLEELSYGDTCVLQQNYNDRVQEKLKLFLFSESKRSLRG